ncbi:hypothetical protein KVT40_000654 [Elsinoe batatas]|uniref:Uncharacterized protein n=1 Tax=Elsinoe batatas TaxID=2601811 RepID=A0A8K0PMW6_9PEZI|nr:hypothetical protein KVT40_000654 [Elsinoe batatas]
MSSPIVEPFEISQARFDMEREAHEEAIQNLRESQQWAISEAMRSFRDTIVMRVRRHWRRMNGDDNDDDEENIYDYMEDMDRVKAESVDYQPVYLSYREDVLSEMGFDDDLTDDQLEDKIKETALTYDMLNSDDGEVLKESSFADITGCAPGLQFVTEFREIRDEVVAKVKPEDRHDSWELY